MVIAEKKHFTIQIPEALTKQVIERKAYDGPLPNYIILLIFFYLKGEQLINYAERNCLRCQSLGYAFHVGPFIN